MSTELSNQYPTGKQMVYVRWFFVMTFFAFLPVIARIVDGASPWMSELAVEYAEYIAWIHWVAKAYAISISPWMQGLAETYVAYISPYIDTPLVAYADALGLFGMVAAGAYFGGYYGMHGKTWKGRYLGIIVPAMAILAVLLIFAAVLNATRDCQCDETAEMMVVAVENVAVGVAGAVLGANVGWRYHVGKMSNDVKLPKEYALLFAIFVGALAVAYVQDAEDNAMLSYVVPPMDAVAVVAGAALGAHFGTYSCRCVDKPWFGPLAAVVLSLAIVIYAIIEQYEIPLYQCVVWLGIALISTFIVYIGAMLGAHISVLLKGWSGMGRRATIMGGEYMTTDRAKMWWEYQGLPPVYRPPVLM